MALKVGCLGVKEVLETMERRVQLSFCHPQGIGGVAKDLSRARDEGTGDLFAVRSGDTQRSGDSR
jgi:hypothetical protein